jgi:Flp pilus assembly protein TadG
MESRSVSKRQGEKMTSVMTKFTRQRGQSIIEIALVTPLLLIALYIPADFGISFFMGNLTQNAAREGARIGSGLQKSGTAPDFVFDTIQANTVKTEVLDRMPAFLSNKSVTLKFYDGTTCMQFIEVTAQGDYNFFLYQLMRLFGGNVPNFVTISRTTQMRYTYQPYTNTAYCTGATTYGPYSS